MRIEDTQVDLNYRTANYGSLIIQEICLVRMGGTQERKFEHKRFRKRSN